MSDSFGKQVEQWIASAMPVAKGGEGSGRYPKGQHAEVATRLRQIAEKAKANDWNSPRTTSRLNTDALGRTYRPQYGSTAKGLVRIANYHIGTLATKLADAIEGDTSKPISQHIAEIRDQAKEMRQNALQNSMYDNFDIASDLKDKAEILGKLAGLVEKEFPTAPPTAVEPPSVDLGGYFGLSAVSKGGQGSGRYPKGSGLTTTPKVIGEVRGVDGRTFRVTAHVEPQTSRLGAGRPIISFYDYSQDPARFSENGQFVSNYYATTLAQKDPNTGLNLQGGVGVWQIPASELQEVMPLVDSIAQTDASHYLVRKGGAGSGRFPKGSGKNKSVSMGEIPAKFKDEDRFEFVNFDERNDASRRGSYLYSSQHNSITREESRLASLIEKIKVNGTNLGRVTSRNSRRSSDGNRFSRISSDNWAGVHVVGLDSGYNRPASLLVTITDGNKEEVSLAEQKERLAVIGEILAKKGYVGTIEKMPAKTVKGWKETTTFPPYYQLNITGKYRNY